MEPSNLTARERSETLPFALPRRPAVTRLRGDDKDHQQSAVKKRTQPMAGFEDRFTDIVDYIVRITNEIWIDRAVGYIYDTYDVSCAIYSPYGVVRSVEDVIASTTATLNAFPDGVIRHLSVTWSGSDDAGFYTSHLGHSRSTNVGRTNWGPGTGRRTSLHFAADCISRDNRIHTEWLVRDNGAAVRQLGYDPHQIARAIAQSETLEQYVIAPDNRLIGQIPREELDADPSTVEGWARRLFDDVWNRRRFDRLTETHSEDVVVWSAGGRTAGNVREYQSLILHVLAAMPDAVMRVDHVSWSEEADGVIVAVRWALEGTSANGGVLGDCPTRKPLSILGISHLRLSGGRVVEEWMLFDEIAVLAQAYRT